jgi:ribosomal protein L6P/L9E
MSRIGRAPIAIPAGVTVTLAAGNTVTWATDSIEGYIHRMTGTLPAIVDAIAKFGASAFRYFHNA